MVSGCLGIVEFWAVWLWLGFCAVTVWLLWDFGQHGSGVLDGILGNLPLGFRVYCFGGILFNTVFIVFS